MTFKSYHLLYTNNIYKIKDLLHDIKTTLHVVNSIIFERLKPTTSYTKVNTPTIRLGPLFLKLYFHVYSYAIYFFIHESSNERDAYHASHAFHALHA